MAFITGMNFSILLDKRQPSSTALKFQDTGIYSPGIAVNFIGYYVVTPTGFCHGAGRFFYLTFHLLVRRRADLSII
jgi:hypothetical protein